MFIRLYKHLTMLYDILLWTSFVIYDTLKHCVWKADSHYVPSYNPM